MVLTFPKKRPPYLDTEVPADKTRIEVERLLYSFGADQVAIVSSAAGRSQLRFIMELDRGGARKKIEVLIDPPHIAKKVRVWDENRGQYVEKELPHHAASWRLVFYYVRAKLQAVASGLNDFEHEFLADTIVNVNGRETTVAQVLIPALERTSGRLQLEEPGEPREARAAQRAVINVEAD
ncbi:MAG: hypothetical protein KGI98_14485 [Euryarchaeota archaeon]|nr:hypothetical protein [Euryarchaeota archaeon]MDE1881152.1 hypothetical protein [Euryarchaeota archaeon]